eukprot:TRINITY_DN3660_c0_g1_i4.p1 TRINITY_DN3660_c0_g1~~TRINITY_DN3660_c0_g1_i4.p1  ORF type:complete len:2686 (-),score=672.81 TRINITY_DN3660_c0_g1_i4:422-8479(-)
MSHLEHTYESASSSHYRTESHLPDDTASNIDDPVNRNSYEPLSTRPDVSNEDEPTNPSLIPLSKKSSPLQQQKKLVTKKRSSSNRKLESSTTKKDDTLHVNVSVSTLSSSTSAIKKSVSLANVNDNKPKHKKSDSRTDSKILTHLPSLPPSTSVTPATSLANLPDQFVNTGNTGHAHGHSHSHSTHTGHTNHSTGHVINPIHTNQPNHTSNTSLSNLSLHTTHTTTNTENQSIPTITNSSESTNTTPEKIKPDIQMVLTPKGTHLKSCSLETLVKELTSQAGITTQSGGPGHLIKEPSLKELVLLTYTSFTNKNALLDLMLERFRIDLSNPEVNNDKNKLLQIRFKSAAFITAWIQSYFEEDWMDDKEFQEKLQKFINEFPEKEDVQVKSLFSNITQKLEKAKTKRWIEEKEKDIKSTFSKKSLDTMNSTSSSSSSVSSLKSLDFDSWDVNVIAEQITLIDAKLWRELPGRECIQYTKSKKKHLECPRVLAFIERFNDITSFSSTQVVLQTKWKERVKMLNKLIALAMKCKELGNYNAMMAIMSGLNATPVHRLKHTWESITKKSQSDFEYMNELMSREDNFRNFRTWIRDTQPPKIPYLGIILQDLLFIDEGNTNLDENNWINIQKRRRWKIVIDQIEQCNVDMYFNTLTPNQSIQNYLLSYTGKDEKWSYDRSLLIEPRNVTVKELQERDLRSKLATNESRPQERIKMLLAKRNKRLGGLSSIHIDWESKYPNDTVEELEKRKVWYLICYNERTYADELELLFNVGIEPLRQFEMVSLDSLGVSELFAAVESLANLHNEFSLMLEKEFREWSPLSDLGSLFIQMESNFTTLYNEYIKHCTPSDKIDNILASNKEMMLYEEEIKQHVNNFTYKSYLLKPLTRFSSYSTQIRDLIKRTRPEQPSYNNLHQALRIVDHIINDCKNIANSIVIDERSNSLVKEIIGYTGHLMTEHRKIMNESTACIFTSDGKMIKHRAIFFNDSLLLARPLNPKDEMYESSDTPKFQFVGLLNNKYIQITSIDKHIAEDILSTFCMISKDVLEKTQMHSYLILTYRGHRETYLFGIENVEESNIWINSFRDISLDTSWWTNLSKNYQNLDSFEHVPAPRSFHTMNAVNQSMFLMIGGEARFLNTRGSAAVDDDSKVGENNPESVGTDVVGKEEESIIDNINTNSNVKHCVRLFNDCFLYDVKSNQWRRLAMNEISTNAESGQEPSLSSSGPSSNNPSPHRRSPANSLSVSRTNISTPTSNSTTTEKSQATPIDTKSLEINDDTLPKKQNKQSQSQTSSLHSSDDSDIATTTTMDGSETPKRSKKFNRAKSENKMKRLSQKFQSIPAFSPDNNKKKVITSVTKKTPKKEESKGKDVIVSTLKSLFKNSNLEDIQSESSDNNNNIQSPNVLSSPNKSQPHVQILQQIQKQAGLRGRAKSATNIQNNIVSPHSSNTSSTNVIQGEQATKQTTFSTPLSQDYSNTSSKGGLSRHTSSTVDQKIFVFGGFSSKQMVSSASNKSSPSITVTDERRFEVSNKMIIYHLDSINLDDNTIDVENINYSETQSRLSIPSPRAGHSSIVYGKEIIVFGGLSPTPDLAGVEYYNDVYSFNTETRLWKKIDCSASSSTPSTSNSSLIPSPRAYHTAVLLQNSKIFIFGGKTFNNVYLNDIWIFDLESKVWVELPSYGIVPSPRAHMASIVLNPPTHSTAKKMKASRFSQESQCETSLILIYGGKLYDKSTLNDVFVYNTDNGKWYNALIPRSLDCTYGHSLVTLLHSEKQTVVKNEPPTTSRQTPQLKRTMSLSASSPPLTSPKPSMTQTPNPHTLPESVYFYSYGGRKYTNKLPSIINNFIINQPSSFMSTNSLKNYTMQNILEDDTMTRITWNKNYLESIDMDEELNDDDNNNINNSLSNQDIDVDLLSDDSDSSINVNNKNVKKSLFTTNNRIKYYIPITNPQLKDVKFVYKTAFPFENDLNENKNSNHILNQFNLILYQHKYMSDTSTENIGLSHAINVYSENISRLLKSANKYFDYVTVEEVTKNIILRDSSPNYYKILRKLDHSSLYSDYEKKLMSMRMNIDRLLTSSIGIKIPMRCKRIKLKSPVSPNSVLMSTIEEMNRVLPYLDHPNIVKFHGVETINDYLWVLWEHQMKSLRIIMDIKSKDINMNAPLSPKPTFTTTTTSQSAHTSSEQNYLSENQIKLIVYQLLKAVSYLHKRNIIHGQIKCLHIFIDMKGKLYLDGHWQYKYFPYLGVKNYPQYGIVDSGSDQAPDQEQQLDKTITDPDTKTEQTETKTSEPTIEKIDTAPPQDEVTTTMENTTIQDEKAIKANDVNEENTANINDTDEDKDKSKQKYVVKRKRAHSRNQANVIHSPALSNNSSVNNSPFQSPREVDGGQVVVIHYQQRKSNNNKNAQKVATTQDEQKQEEEGLPNSPSTQSPVRSPLQSMLNSPSPSILSLPSMYEQNSWWHPPTDDSEKVSFKADMWAIGICILEMIGLSPPFTTYTENEALLSEKIEKIGFSKECFKFVQSCLKDDIENVSTCTDLLESSDWLKEVPALFTKKKHQDSSSTGIKSNEDKEDDREGPHFNDLDLSILSNYINTQTTLKQLLQPHIKSSVSINNPDDKKILKFFLPPDEKKSIFITQPSLPVYKELEKISLSRGTNFLDGSFVILDGNMNEISLETPLSDIALGEVHIKKPQQMTGT